ncbi:MAG: hypothetical protein ACLP7O_01580 [Terracidiphilus sp.]
MKPWIVAIVNIHRGARFFGSGTKAERITAATTGGILSSPGMKMEIPVHMQVVASQSGNSPEGLPATLQDGATANWKEKAKAILCNPICILRVCGRGRSS